MKKIYRLILIPVLVLGGSCSHRYDSNVLGLDFYQWNLWQDTGVVRADDLPSCGWEDLDRGMGMLVRIPASLDTYFPDREESSVFWYHCRFSLPESWKERPISLVFQQAGPEVKIFLNQEEAGSFRGEEGPVELDVSDVIYHTRDNHLCIRVSNPGGIPMGEKDGITGTILVTSKEIGEGTGSQGTGSQGTGLPGTGLQGTGS